MDKHLGDIVAAISELNTIISLQRDNNNNATSREDIKNDVYIFNGQFSPVEFVNLFKNYYGPSMNAFEAADKNGKADELQQELEVLFNSQNKGGKSTTSIPATFLRVTVNR